jgi:hypothetical protein
MSFQYFNAGAWVTVATHTGIRNNVLYSYVIPNTVTRFRFRLITDATVNTYGFPFTNVYYYDIDYFDITCSVVLPIELLYFTGEKLSCGTNYLIWETASELNNDRFEVERSNDAINFINIGVIKNIGTSTNRNKYNFNDTNPKQELNYYRLKQIDYNGEYKYSQLISVDNSCDKNVTTIKITNLLGQEVDDNYYGVVVIHRSDNTIIKRFQIKSE